MIDPTTAIAVPTRLFGEQSSPNQCFTNVATLVARHGGAAVFGWLAGEVVFPDAPTIQTWVHHCVWDRPEGGGLVEVTPQILAFQAAGMVAQLAPTVRFVRDDAATLVAAGEGRVKARLSEYTPLVADERVHRAIEAFCRADHWLDEGDMARELYWARRGFALLEPWSGKRRIDAATHRNVPFKLERTES